MGTKLIKQIHSQAPLHNSRLLSPRKSCCTKECGASVIGGLQFCSSCCKGQSCVCLPPYACGSEIATSRCEVAVMGSLRTDAQDGCRVLVASYVFVYHTHGLKPLSAYAVINMTEIRHAKLMFSTVSKLCMDTVYIFPTMLCCTDCIAVMSRNRAPRVRGMHTECVQISAPAKSSSVPKYTKSSQL